MSNSHVSLESVLCQQDYPKLILQTVAVRNIYNFMQVSRWFTSIVPSCSNFDLLYNFRTFDHLMLGGRARIVGERDELWQLLYDRRWYNRAPAKTILEDKTDASRFDHCNHQWF